MITKILIVIRLVFGKWTPFLKPPVFRKDRKNSGTEALKKIIADNFELDGRQIALSASGRSAIYAVLNSLPMNDKKEVICASFSCTGVVSPIILAGYTPVFADIDESLHMSLDGFLQALSPRTKSVIVPHICGMWNPHFEDICEHANRLGVVVIEDAAQADGLEFGDFKAGRNGDFSIVSYGLGKLIPAPLGGGVISSDISNSLDDKIWCQSDGYIRDRYAVWSSHRQPAWRRGLSKVWAKIWTRSSNCKSNGIEKDGTPLKLDEATGEIISALYSDKFYNVDQRRKNAAYWVKLLEKENWAIEWAHAPLAFNTCLKFWLRLPYEVVGRLKLHLWECGVEVEDLYTPLHLRSEYRKYYTHELPNTEKLYKMVFCVPVRPNLEKSDLERFKAAISSFEV